MRIGPSAGGDAAGVPGVSVAGGAAGACDSAQAAKAGIRNAAEHQPRKPRRLIAMNGADRALAARRSCGDRLPESSSISCPLSAGTRLATSVALSYGG